MEIKIKKLSPSAIIPTKAHSTDAGVDLYADMPTPVIIPPHYTEKIGTGLAIAAPHGYFGAVVARSGLSTKEGLRPGNCIGICDEAYRGEYIVALHNDSEDSRTVMPGQRIAQLIFLPYLDFEFTEVEELDETDRGSDGFGASGK